MARVQLNSIHKKYGEVEALKNIDLVIQDKEFLVLFGPAGAGKTTMLKIIAGIELPSDGTVIINDGIVNLVEASERNVAMVFENYALYPQMTVFDNIAFPLRSKRYRQPENVIKERVESVTSLLKIDKYLSRLPVQLSNGQKQRVAIGRCLVRTPAIFLMDEPLAHLDAKMRHFMRAELKEMQANFDTTTLYVTHDYMEALSLGDRIVILNEGGIEQIGTGQDIYHRPVNEFVAKLVGEPEINIFPVTLENSGNSVQLEMFGVPFDIPDDLGKKLSAHNKTAVDFGIRAQYMQYAFTPPMQSHIKGTVYSFEPIGNKAILVVDVDGTQIRMKAPNDLQAEMNSEIYLTFKVEKALYFDTDTKILIAHADAQNRKA